MMMNRLEHPQAAHSSHHDVLDHNQRTLGSYNSLVRQHETCDSNLHQPCVEEHQASHGAYRRRFREA